ncbi:MAG: hypothetical protein RL660_2759 [Bacteroidota bacterium]|jgi:hypothetical protein
MKAHTLVVIFQLFFVSAFAQQTKYQMPNRLSYTSPIMHDSLFQQRQSLRDELLLIGFSKDDKVAYLVEPADEACGCYFLEMHIKDLRANKIVWQWKYEGPMGDSTDCLAKQWELNYKQFAAALSQHGIQQSRNLKLNALPLKMPTATYNFKVQVDTLHIEQWIDVIDDVKIIATRKGKAPKTVATQKHTYLVDDDMSGKQIPFGGTLSCRLDYYIQNPFTKKVALLYCYENRGYEGIPTVYKFEVLGIDLPK